MRKFQAKPYFYFKISLGIIFVIVLFFLISQKIVFGNSLIYTSQSRFVQGPYPEGRIYLNNKIVQIVNDPVYYDIYMPRQFNQVEVKLNYQKIGDFDAKIGLKLDIHDYAFYFENLDSTNGFETKTFTFNLNQVEIRKNKIQFAVSAPEVKNGKLFIKDAEFTFLK